MTSRAARGQLVPRGPNRWIVRMYVGMRDGKKRYVSKAVTGTFHQAQKVLTAMLNSLDTHAFVAPSKLTLGVYLQGWLEGKIDVSSRSRVSYRQNLKRFSGAIGHLKLTDLTMGAVQGVIGSMVERGLSQRTMEYTRAILHAAMEDAVQGGLLVRNPVDYTKLPPRVKRAATILTMEQVDTLLARTKDDPLHALWVLLLTSGMRPQEALALKWTDLNLEDAWLSIQRTLVDDGHGKCSLVEATKTEGSTRRIGLPASTIATLKSHRAKQRREIMLLGQFQERLDLVFPNQRGRPLDHNGVRRRWKKALTLAKLPAVRLYDSRHTHLTALLQNGADIAWVAARAGHRDIKMTRDHYAHVLPEVHREMGEMTERMLQKATARNQSQSGS